MLTRTAGVELAPHGITVVGIAPGAVHTPIDDVTLSDPAAKAKLESAIPLGRVAEPEEIARIVAFLASDACLLRHRDHLRRRRRDDAGERGALGRVTTIARSSDARKPFLAGARLGPVEPGVAHPLGATVTPTGVNFGVYAKHATGMDIQFFYAAEDLTPDACRQPRPGGPSHRGVLARARAGRRRRDSSTATWRTVRGRREDGLRFDPTKLLLDPYGRGVAVPPSYRRLDAGVTDDMATTMKSVVTDTRLYDWEGDAPLNRPWRETVVYEAHLAGMTRDPASGVPAELRGTYAGLIEKIPYLIDLGVTAIELLPVFQFDPQAAPAGHTNYWGYQPISFFAPHAAYSSQPGPTAPLDEFRDLVKALHRAGLEVILDVVYNHTSEGGANGPTASLPRPRQRRLLPARPAGPLDVHRLQRHRQHVQGQRPDRPPADPRQPPLLGRGDARRRLPLRPRGGPVTGRGRPAAVGSADHLGDRDRPGPGRHEADRRGVGCRRASTRSAASWRPLGGVERPIPRRHPRRTCAASRAGSGT